MCATPAGNSVPVSSFATVRWSVGPSQIVGFNYYPSVASRASAKPGYTSGDAIGEMERLAAQLPRGFGYDWTGQSLQEKLSGSQAPFLLMLSVLAGVSRSRRALRELDDTAGGAADRAARHPRRGGGGDAARAAERRLFHGRHRDHHRPCRQGRHPDHRVRQGLARAGPDPIKDATIEACRMRFRPIVMTGLAFVFGVAPMIVAAAPAPKSQQALGTGVMGGMTAVVILALLMVPFSSSRCKPSSIAKRGKNFGPRQLPRRNRRRSRPTPAPGQVWRGDRQGNTRRYLAKPTLRRPSTKGSKSAGFLCGSTLRRCSTE